MTWVVVAMTWGGARAEISPVGRDDVGGGGDDMGGEGETGSMAHDHPRGRGTPWFSDKSTWSDYSG